MLVVALLALQAPVQVDDTFRVQTIVDDRCLKSAEDKTVCLHGVILPQTGNMPKDDAPFARQAADWLTASLKERWVYLSHEGSPDRWQRQPVHLRLAPQLPPLQLLMLREGIARLDPMAEVPTEWVVAEAEARKARRGLWAIAAYQDREAEVLAAQGGWDDYGALVSVVGTVQRVAFTRARVYLNFGADYRTDFTVSIPMATYRRWERVGADARQLEGTAMRVTGRLTVINGPSMEVTAATQFDPQTKVLLFTETKDDPPLSATAPP